MRVKFKFFKSAFSTWDMMFQEAADFASGLPKDRLINISHSADRNVGVVTVWYWGDGSDDEHPDVKTADETDRDWLRHQFGRTNKN